MRTLGEAQGLPPCRIETLCEGPDGRIWVGTWGQGVLRDEGDRLEPVTELDAYGPELWSSLLDRDGRLWFGTFQHGAVCVDGDSITPFGRAEGLAHDSVWGLHQDRRGRLWFATQGGGLTCLDGRRVTTYTTADGLPNDNVWAVAEDADGAIWCSTFDSGVCRFDGRRFERFTSLEGLAHDQVWCILPAADGNLWFGTWGGGASRWDGAGFTTYTTRDGLANNSVRALHQSRDGHLWFGTFGGGMTRFDGHAFQTLSRREGLVHDAVQDIVDDADGRVWIATEGGITVYTPPTEPPTVGLGDIVADRRYHTDDDVVLTTKQHLVTFEFAGASFSTVRERLVYAWRLRGRFDEWRTTTRRRAEVRDLPAGRYTFEVCAVDRDLNWSEPVAREIAVDVDAGADRLQALQAELAGTPEVDPFIGRSPSLARVLDQIDVVAPSDLTVLIQGETGTGKGLAAHALHSLSPRREGPFLQVNCGALPEGLVESELFGHEEGAFTGAVTRRIGRFELAEGGTLFLDEIGDLPTESQRALLQVLQEGVYQRVGGQRVMSSKVRVIAATNRDLQQSAAAGTFREDLYYRLSPFVLHMPPLRERRDDIALLTTYFLERFSRHLSREAPMLSPEALALLREYDFPGNVRELEHVVQRAVLVCRDGTVRPTDLSLAGAAETPPRTGAAPDSLDAFDDQSREAERAFLAAALEACNGVVYGERGAARRLGVHPEKLRRRLRRAGLGA
jgi:two-component system response regulator AtoC